MSSPSARQNTEVMHEPVTVEGNVTGRLLSRSILEATDLLAINAQNLAWRILPG
jgi:hypothetical protein